MNTKERPLFILRARPKSHAPTRQQLLIKEAAAHCGIRKGMTRKELVNGMRECIPKFFKDKREESINATNGSMLSS